MKKKSHLVKFILMLSFLPVYLLFVYFLPVYPAIVYAEASDITGDMDAATWKIYTSTVSKNCMTYSDDKAILWIGTDGGLEKRNAETGELIRLYTTLSGLPYNIVAALAADGNGGIWVGTWGGGLARLSAENTWRVYNKEDSSPYLYDVNALLPDNNGGLWIGSNSGLYYLSADGTWRSYNTENSGLPDYDVNALTSDGSGGIWIGTGRLIPGLFHYTHGGLVHFSVDGIWSVYDTDNSGLPCNIVHALISDGNGGVWIGSGAIGRCGGLAHLSSNGVWTVYNTENSGLPAYYVDALLLDGNGGIWVGTGMFETNGYYSSGGLAYLSPEGAWTVYNTENSSLPADGINTLMSDGSGGIWIGTGWHNRSASYYSPGGLAHLSSDGTWTIYGRDNSSLPSNNVSSFLSDGNGGVWIAAIGISLTHLSADGSVVVYNAENSELPNNNINSMVPDNNGGIWVGTGWLQIDLYSYSYGGLLHLSADGTSTVYNIENTPPLSAQISFLASDGRGGVWIGTSNHGLAHLSIDGVWRVYNTENSALPYNHIQSLVSDSNGGVWIGTSADLYSPGILTHLSSDGTWKVYTAENSTLPGNGVYSVISDGGGIWGHVSGGGLAHLSSDGTWRVYTTENSSIPNNEVFALTPDADGGIWVGVSNGGMAHLSSDDIWTVYNTENSGIPENRIRSLVPDSNGGIWVVTENQGISYLSTDGIWTVYNEENSVLSDYGVHSLISDGNNGVWIESNGVFHLTFDKTVVKVDLNNTVYNIGDHLTLDITLSGREAVDLYVLAFYPDSDFQSVIYPYYFSRINTVKAYREAIDLSGQQTLHVLDETIESNQKPGAYTYYGIAVKAGLDPFNTGNWLYSTFKTYHLR